MNVSRGGGWDLGVSENFACGIVACNYINDVSISSRNQERVLGRKPEGMAACLLPFEQDGRIAREAFEAAVCRTEEAGLKCAVNMDTGYANYLTDGERNDVLDWTRGALGDGKPFVAGVFVEGLEGDLLDLYRRGADAIAERGGTPIVFQDHSPPAGQAWYRVVVP